MRYFKVIFIVLLFFFSMLFFIQNPDLINTTLSLKMNLLGKVMESQPIPIYLLVLIAFVVGSFLSVIYLIIDKLKAGKQIREYRQKIAELEKELTSLRNMPLNDETDYQSSENL
ncbi:MAG: hypothetical protein PWR24_1525 [Desulfonauticus sp.]|jgi:uncharacterized integral membrane protein|nr:hypothetical protein [Desulfonauticus sp.]